jgi:hypothetical protein
VFIIISIATGCGGSSAPAEPGFPTPKLEQPTSRGVLPGKR